MLKASDITGKSVGCKAIRCFEEEEEEKFCFAHQTNKVSKRSRLRVGNSLLSLHIITSTLPFFLASLLFMSGGH